MTKETMTADRRRSQNLRMRERRADVRDCAEQWHDVKNAVRKESCRNDLGLFLQTYLHRHFYLPLSNDHKRFIAMMQNCVLHGGQFAHAVFRGFGKTTLCEGCALWALLYGHRRFVVFVGADVVAALLGLASLQSELETNDDIDADFPEVTVPIRALEGVSRRTAAQTFRGERTRCVWTKDRLTLPTMPGSCASGAMLVGRGITGRIRGMKHKLQDGTIIRPDLAIIDDPQTDESASSLTQVVCRERLVSGAILGLAGHDQTIAAFMPCTIIRRDDLADRLTDATKHPDWHGERIPMVLQWPECDQTLWRKTYADLRREDLLDGTRKATEFYLGNREEMDRGAKLTWEHCKAADEESALQHAYNFLLDRGEAVFAAEYQNDPLDEMDADGQLDPAELATRVNQHQAGVAPGFATNLSAFIDVMPGGSSQPTRLYWMVVASDNEFTSAIVDYGVHVGGNVAQDGLAGCLDQCVAKLVAREWTTDSGAVLSLSTVMVDSGDETETIYRWARECPNRAIVLPSKGEGRTAMDLTRKKPGRRVGERWCVGPTPDGRKIRLVRHDANYWRTFASRRLMAPMGTPGACSINGKDPRKHRLLVEHLTAEYSVKVTERDQTYDKWACRPGRPNHWWDCLVGCFVGLSTQGCYLRQMPGKGTSAAGGGRKAATVGWMSSAARNRR